MLLTLKVIDKDGLIALRTFRIIFIRQYTVKSFAQLKEKAVCANCKL